MPGMVTLIHCRGCSQNGILVLQDGRFWCSWCGDWARVEARQVANALVVEKDGVPSLVPCPPRSPSLQPLRVPSGWSVVFNNGLYEADPFPGQIPEGERVFLFKQDMLQMRHERRDRLLDLGWYPDGDLDQGSYRLVLHKGDFNGPLLHEFSTRDRLLLVAEIERLLRTMTEGKL